MKNKWKNGLAILVALMMAPAGVMAEEAVDAQDTPAVEISAEKEIEEVIEEEAVEDAAEEEPAEDISEDEEEEEKEKRPEREKKQKDKKDIKEEKDETEDENFEKLPSEKQEKDHGKPKFDKAALEAKKQERRENRLEAKAFFEEIKEAFSEADVETKQEILAEIAAIKKELKDDSIGMFVKGKHVDFDKYDGVKPEIEKDRTLIPLRAAVEILEADVLWKAEDRTITVMKDEIEIVLQIDNMTAVVNGEAVELDCAPSIKKDRTMVPVRFLAETLELEVTWDEESKTVIAE